MSQSHSSKSIDRGLLLIRLTLGLVFFMHGWQKLTVFGFAGTAGFLESIGVPLPGLNAVVIIAVETLGGLLMAAGAGTRVVGSLLTFAMLVAVVTVHASNGFFLPDGYEFAMTMGLVSLGLVLTGAGRYSVDARVFAPRSVSSPAVTRRPMAA